MSAKFLAIVGFILLGLGGLFVLTQKHTPKTGGSNSQVQASNHVAGKGTSGVTLVEYGDYQCPACGAYYPLVKQVQQKYGDQLKFQFRNFPLSQIHQNAFAGARAAEAAALQNKFWEMHDILYEQQSSWESLSSPTTAFETYAQQLGLDMAKFRSDYSSSQVNDIINADIQAGQSFQINATPTFILNGKKISDNPRDLDAFDKLIDDAIAAQKKAQTP